MPLKLHQVMKKSVPFTLEYEIEGGGTDSLKGMANVNVYTPKYIGEVNNMDKSDPTTLARLLVPLIISWEWTYSKQDHTEGLCEKDDIGKLVPHTQEFLSGLPIDFLGKLLGAIQEALSPSPNSVPESKGSSFQADEEGPVLVSTE